MIASSKNDRENYPRKCFWTQENKSGVKVNYGLSAEIGLRTTDRVSTSAWWWGQTESLNCPGRMRIPGIRNLTKLQCGIRERFKGYGIWRQNLGTGCGIGKGKRYSGVAMTDEFRNAGFSRMKTITEAMIRVFPREINVLEIEGILGCWPVGYVDFTKVILRGCMNGSLILRTSAIS